MKVSPYLEMPLRTLQQVEATRQRRAAKLARLNAAAKPAPGAAGGSEKPAQAPLAPPGLPKPSPKA